MTTREELEALEKKDLVELAEERFGQTLSLRNNRKTLIHSILRLAGVPVEDSDEADDDVEDPAPEDRPSVPKGHVAVTVTRCPDSTGVHLNVNGKRFHLPPNQTTPVPAWIIPSLRDTAGVDFTVE